MFTSIQQQIDSHYDEMVRLRRYLHEHPELSFKEYETAKYIVDYYKQLGLPVQSNIGGNGVIATLKGGLPGKTIALRADFDALPIQDEKNVPYKSKVPGVMHACAHDGHTATLLVLAKVMQQFQKNLQGTIVFLHQHAEELPPGGAISIVKSGALKEVDAIFGNHLWTTLPLGTVETRNGIFLAGADRFEITIQGKGGHGAYPHISKDAVVIGAELVQKIQTIVSRRLSPLDTGVVTIGQFQAGNAFNIIADEAVLHGTVRYLNSAVQTNIKHELERIVKGVCYANDCEYELNYIDGYPPIVNHEKETDIIFKACENIAEVKEANVSEIQMGGEDFAYYVEKIPGAFFFTGAKKKGHSYPHHHPMFDIDERSMPIAAKVLIGAYLEYQQQHR